MSRSVSVAGVSLELEERGKGPPLLFLHRRRGAAAASGRGSICWRSVIA